MVKFERILRGEHDDVPSHAFKINVTQYSHDVINYTVQGLREKYYKLNAEAERGENRVIPSSERIVIVYPPPNGREQSYIILSIPKKYYENDEWMLNLTVDLVTALNNNLLHYGDV